MKDSDFHLVSSLGTIVAAGLVMAAVLWADREADAATRKNPLDDMEVIDAALAELPPEPNTQVKKPVRPPPPPEEPQGVSHDDKAKPVLDRPDKPRPPPPPDDPTDLLDKYRRDNQDDDLAVGKPVDQPQGAFDGDKRGFGDETRGDKFLGALKADLVRGWEYPEILDDVGTPVGCIHMEPDGKIPEIKLYEKSGNAELDDSVERALKKLQTLRNDEPELVPTHLLPRTRQWICYRMKVK